MIIVVSASTLAPLQPDGDFGFVVLGTDLVGLLESISQEVERVAACPWYRLNGISIPVIFVDDIDSLFIKATRCWSLGDASPMHGDCAESCPRALKVEPILTFFALVRSCSNAFCTARIASKAL